MVEKELEDRYITEAKRDDPTGNFCAWCGKPNDNADDCGWWYITPFRTGQLADIGAAACNECHDGPLGDSHRKRFGVGDR
tara:strand:+ start:856 stop:1095 length:240 start_codon:yes stop_codon:yes gene_type:complete